MIPSPLQFTPQSASGPQGPVVVELSARQLPPRMRLGRLRSSIGLSIPRTHGLRRALMAPVAIMTRLLSR